MKTKSFFVATVVILVFSTTGFSINLLNNHSFETDEETSGGWPTSPLDVWKGDYSSIVTAENGIVPYNGTQMLKFLGTGFLYESADGSGCGVQQVIDLSSYKSQIETGNATLNASAYFNRVAGDNQTDTSFTLKISLWEGEPDNYDWANWPNDPNLILIEEAEIFSDNDPSTWEVDPIEIALSQETDYVAIQLAAIENIYNNSSYPEFDGHYADLSSVEVFPEPSTLLLLDPNGGESLTAGKPYPIKWSSTGSISDVLIEYSTDNGSTWTEVTPPNTDNNGLYNWLVPAVDSNQCLIRMSDTNDPNISDTSGDVFTIESPVGGYVVAWGWNSSGQTDVPLENDFITITGGYEHCLAIKVDGSLAAWGGNSEGQCDVPEGNDFVAIATSWAQGIALGSDYSVDIWGCLYCGMYCEGACDAVISDDFVSIAAGITHNLALKSDGSLVGWGSNSDVPAGNDFISIAAGDDHNLALKSDGSIVGWGDNYYGQATPPAGNDFIAIAAGGSQSLALKSDGSIVGWGRDYYGQATPPDGNDFIAIAAGNEHSLALKSDGSIVGWGAGEPGETGWPHHGQATPPAGNDFIAIAAGWYHSLALLEPLIGGYIDFSDLAILCDRWLADDCSNPKTSYWCDLADIDRSGNVDFTDYARLGCYWLETAPAPNAPSNPEPNDLATNVSITADLSWTTGSDTAAHGVYFGETSPGNFQGYQMATLFDTSTLETNTTYYWRIVEVGLSGTTTGDVWSFTTAPPPSQASTPNPTDTETDVSITADLSWTVGSDTTSHDVYFGTTAPGEFQGNQTVATFSPDTLGYETTYYWRVDEVGPGGTTAGNVWSFTTIIDPNLVGWWKFNETSGIIAYDSSVNGNHGTLFDGLGAGLVWEPNEGALNFDGSNNLSCVMIPTSGMSATAGTLTIWAYLAEPQNREDGRNGNGYFFGMDNGSIDKVLLYMNNSDTQFDIRVGNKLKADIVTLSTETWYHIAITWDAGSYAVYVDGSPLDTGTYGGLSSLPSTADIGNNGDSHTQSFHGFIGEAMIYDRALSYTEVQQLHNEGPN